MNQFYISIVFLGIILIITALVWIALDKRKAHVDAKQIEEKKNELIRVIEDAEQMLLELNKFSDYIVTQINEKNDQLNDKLNEFEDRVSRINIEQSKTQDLILDNSFFDNREKGTEFQSNNYDKVKKKDEKVIPINIRHKEILQLSSTGLSDTEIAKRLNMGKGEIQLILDMNK
jgi:ATP/maltotriose-dependent transcriptional regulator MalT